MDEKQKAALAKLLEIVSMLVIGNNLELATELMIMKGYILSEATQTPAAETQTPATETVPPAAQ